MTRTIETYIEMDNSELLALYDSLRNEGEGEGIGDEPNGTSDQSPSDAVAAEGWTIVRNISDRSDVETILARGGDALYIVSDIYGPWAIQITDAEGHSLR